MAIDYQQIRAENKQRYGTDIGRIGPMLLADRYADRTHFIFELLQNAEDAFNRRDAWAGDRQISFVLTNDALRVSHFGVPFSQRDVRGICGIAEGTKNQSLTSIGCFGIGFKSVYAFTDRPQVHSGDEDFAIESFVWPTSTPSIDRNPEETVFILPFRENDEIAKQDIVTGLRRLGPRVLLFLREIEEISWDVTDGPSGLYLRSKPEPVGSHGRIIELVGQEENADDTEETWLVFSKEVRTDDDVRAGFVELAFLLRKDAAESMSIQPIYESPLVVFFPTVLPTYLGFLVQGPYRTTPSRDNIPHGDEWNQHLIRETATLLVTALRDMRDMQLLDASALQSLPMDRTKFSQDSMFSPLFTAVREALSSEALLPRFGGGHVSAQGAKLARTQELRELFSTAQLGGLFPGEEKFAWLSAEITQDRTPELRRYLMGELDIAEVTPDVILARLEKEFLEPQDDTWILALYEFLNGQPALHRRVMDVPVVRLEDGTHTKPMHDGRSRCFLPSSFKTGFPTVRQAVCTTEDARQFLASIGLTEPDPVDDVIWNVLPKYRKDKVDVTADTYQADVRRILAAFGTDSKGQREKLTADLRETSFVMAINAGDGTKLVSKPGDVYRATQRMKDLFDGVSNVLLVDDSSECLRGDDARELLEACGATRYPRPVSVQPEFTTEQLRKMRRQAGWERNTDVDTLNDYTLHGLKELLSIFPTLPYDDAKKRSQLLWEALCDLAERRSQRVFSGRYQWFYYSIRSCDFEAAFVRRNNR